MYKKIIEKLEGKSISILGFGREGISTYKLIREHLPKQHLTIIDKSENLLERNDFLKQDKNITIIVGDKYLDNLDIYDYIIKSPGVKINRTTFDKIRNKITSQMELTLELFSKQIIGVTGTKGKSTTSTLIYEVLKNQGKHCFLLGNIGTPIFNYIDQIASDSILVIEMSCLQLETVKYSPHIGIILNLFEEHFDYFNKPEDYFLSKLNVFKYQTTSDYALYTSSNKLLNDYVINNKYNSILLDMDKDYKKVNNFIVYNNKNIYDTISKRLLLGDHNLENILFVLKVSELLNLDLNKTIETINVFKPLEHRMEYVGEYNGIKYYNDSIATIPDATINCLKTIPDVDTIIFGGMDRGIHYQPLIDYFNSCNVENYICMPETGYKIADKLVNKKIYKVETLEEAVSLAKKVTHNTCVLSPSAPSYNAFKNFEEKGNRYKELVKKYT